MRQCRFKMSSVLFFCVLAFLLGAAECGSYCTSRSFGRSRYMYCSHGCCGSYYSRTCCSGWSTPTIVGAIISGLVILAIIVGIAVACYCSAKGKTRRGRVIPLSNRNQGNASTIVVNNPNFYQHWHGPYNNPQYLPPPPEYKRLMTPPPAYPGTPTPRGARSSTTRSQNPTATTSGNFNNETLPTLNTPTMPHDFQHPPPVNNLRNQHPPPAPLNTPSAPPPINTNLEHM